MMIWDEMPWRCYEKDCAAQWHKRTYWAHPDGTFSVDEYSDGDHEEVEGGDLPDPEEVAEQWAEYNRYVVETGKDPLGNFAYGIKTRWERSATWQVVFRPSLLGLRLIYCRRNARGPWLSADKLPEEARTYLCIEPFAEGSSSLVCKAGTDKDGQTSVGEVKALLSEDENCTLQRGRGLDLKALVRVTEYVPRLEFAIERDLRRAARKALAR